MRKRNIAWLAASLLLLSACNDSQYDLENLVPDAYHKILYVNNSGKQEMTLYDTNEDYTYPLTVIKAGSDPTLTAHVKVNILTQEEVDSEYSAPEAVTYKLLTDDSYSLSAKEMDFTSDDRFKTVDISVNSTKVKALIESEPDTKWVIPLKVTSESDSINTGMNELFLQIAGVVTPSVGFVIPDEDDTQEYDNGAVPAIEKKIAISLDTENKWDISCGIAVDNDYIATYNDENRTVYQALPAGSYTLPESVDLPSGTTSDTLSVKIDGSKITTPGDYMLPVVVKTTSKFQISETANVYPIKIRVVGKQLDRSGWTATATSEEATGEGSNGSAQLTLDGDLSTYWHSIWSTGTGVRSLPYEIVIDTKSTHTFSQFGMVQRSVSYMDTKGGEVYISSDNSDWTLVGYFTLKQTMSTQIFSVVPTKGRYVKFKITSSYRDQNCSLSEIYAYGSDN